MQYERPILFVVLEKLKALRHQHLAHRRLPRAPVAPERPDTLEQQGLKGETPVWATGDEIETFYQDSLEIMSLLLSLVQGLAYDRSEATDVYKHHAKYFWASARGEHSDGHPNDRPSPRDFR